MRMFQLFGLGPFVPIHGQLNTGVYCTILDDNVLLRCGNFIGWNPVTSWMTTATAILRSSYSILRSNIDWYGDKCFMDRTSCPEQIENLKSKLDRRVQMGEEMSKLSEYLTRIWLPQAEWIKIPIAVM